jgi:hypothetical protein
MKIFDTIVSYGMSERLIIMLRHNRIGEVTTSGDHQSGMEIREHLTYLLRHNFYVDIMDNPFRSNCNDFFLTVDAELLRSLIWIQNGWVSSDDWNQMFDQLKDDRKYRINIVKLAHQEYCARKMLFRY